MIRSIASKIEATMQQQGDRDKQKLIGPSDMSDLCELCLGEKIAAGAGIIEAPDQDGGNLATWLGTAFHEKLEYDERDETVQTERKVPITHIEGYGTITGTSDRYDAEYSAVVDYKGTTLAKLKKYNKGFLRHDDGRVTFYEDTLLRYYIQLNLYGLGVERLGEVVRTVAVWFVPRDSTRFSDCKLLEFPYDREVAKQAVDRTHGIYKWVVEHGLDELESAHTCFNCMRLDRIDR